MALRLTDEIVALPKRSGTSSLIANRADRGRWEVLPGSELPASAWHKGTVASSGGSFTPPWWSDDPLIECHSVHVFRLRDAYYVPELGGIISAAGEVMKTTMAEAAYLGAPLDVLPHVEHRKSDAHLSLPDAVDTLEEIVVTMPWGATSNYGHFLLDCLPAVASILEIPDLSSFRFAFPPLKPWQRRHLELLGVDRPMELDRSIYRISDVIFTSCMDNFLHHPNVNYRTLRHRQLARQRRTEISAKKVYLTRRGVVTRSGATKRTFLSEQELEERLGRQGFVIVAPEELTIDEQIGLFSNADVVVGCAGAAFANAIYCREDATLVEITPARMVVPATVSGKWLYTSARLSAASGGRTTALTSLPNTRLWSQARSESRWVSHSI